MNFSLFYNIPALCKTKFYKNENIWLCNKYLNEFSTVKYLHNGKLTGINACNVFFGVCPTDNGYSVVLKNIKLYIMICKKTKEYILCTMNQIRQCLHGIGQRWKFVEIHPYGGPHSFLYYGVCCYNFAILNLTEQKKNVKYICDASLLQRGKYSVKELIHIAYHLEIPVENIKNRKQLQQLIYTFL